MDATVMQPSKRVQFRLKMDQKEYSGSFFFHNDGGIIILLKT